MTTKHSVRALWGVLVGADLLLVALCSSLNAQVEKEVPPPIPLEADSLEPKKESLEKKPTIELPDVIIYGEDLGRQTGGQKLPVEGAEPVVPQSGSERVKSEATTGSRKEVSGMGLPLKSLIGSAYAQYGRFDTWGIGGSLAGQAKDIDHNLSADYWRSDGHVDRSRNDGFRLRMGGGYRASSRLRLTASGGYEHRDFGLYGLESSRARRDLSLFHLQGETSTRPLEGMTAGGIVRYRRLHVKDESSGGEVTEDLVRGDLRAEGSIGKFTLIGSGWWLGDYVEDTWSHDNHLLSLEVASRWPVNPRLVIQAGVRYQSLSPSEGNRKERVSPLARITYRPLEELGLSFAGSGEYAYRPLERFLAVNDFADLSIGSQVEEVRVALEAEVEHRPMEKVWTRYRVSHRQVKGSVAWEDRDDDTLFEISSFPEVRELSGGVEIAFYPLSDLSATVSLTLSDHDVTDPPDRSSTYRVPFEERIGIEGSVSYLLPWKILGSLQGEYRGERYTHAASEGEKASDYGLLNARLERALGSRLTLYLTGQNLTDARYVVWPGYREPGIRGSFGMKVRW